MAKKKKQEDYGQKIEEELARWSYLNENGGSDPFWPDGTNMNLVRNHIIYYKRQIEAEMKPEEYPDAYYCELPPEVPEDFIVNPEGIREAANASLAIYLADPNFQYLRRRIDSLDPKVVKKLSVDNVVYYALGLRDAIFRDDLIHMRRHRNPETYQSSFESSAQKVREYKPPENEQINMFYSYDDPEPGEDELDDELAL